jgi:hypothetical protein
MWVKLSNNMVTSRVLDKISEFEHLSFNGFCNCGFGLGGFPLLGYKGMHSSPSNLEGMIYSLRYEPSKIYEV